mmetsp:Transcript_18267/g.59778  ORF Transcript_18267/g.59778 Transcript_18267/m.59778 type:complete len:252 (-) Transcript_18267:1965-2720(-)
MRRTVPGRELVRYLQAVQTARRRTGGDAEREREGGPVQQRRGRHSPAGDPAVQLVERGAARRGAIGRGHLLSSGHRAGRVFQQEPFPPGGRRDEHRGPRQEQQPVRPMVEPRIDAVDAKHQRVPRPALGPRARDAGGGPHRRSRVRNRLRAWFAGGAPGLFEDGRLPQAPGHLLGRGGEDELCGGGERAGHGGHLPARLRLRRRGRPRGGPDVLLLSRDIWPRQPRARQPPAGRCGALVCQPGSAERPGAW